MGRPTSTLITYLIDIRWESRILIYEIAGELTVIPNTVWCFAKFRERLVVSKQAAQNFDGEIFDLRKLNELQVRKQYQIEITNSFAALEILSDGKDINRAWENIKENIKPPAKESLCLHKLKQHKPCFDECVGFLDKSKQAKV